MTPEIYYYLAIIGRLLIFAAIIVAGAKLSRFNMVLRGTYFLGAAAYIAYAIAFHSFKSDNHMSIRLIGLYGLVAIIGVLSFAIWGMTKNPDKHKENK